MTPLYIIVMGLLRKHWIIVLALALVAAIFAAFTLYTRSVVHQERARAQGAAAQQEQERRHAGEQAARDAERSGAGRLLEGGNYLLTVPPRDGVPSGSPTPRRE